MHFHHSAAHRARHSHSRYSSEYPALFGAVQNQAYEPQAVEQFEPHRSELVRRIVRAIRHRLRKNAR